MSAGQPVTAGNLFTAKGMEFYYPTGHIDIDNGIVTYLMMKLSHERAN